MEGQKIKGIGNNNMGQMMNMLNPQPTPQPTPDPTPEPTPTPEPDNNSQPDPAPAPNPEPAPTPEGNQDPTPEPVGDPEPESNPTPEPAPTPEPLQLNDEAVLNYFKEQRGKELNSLDDLFKEPEPVVNPLEGLSEEVLQFVKFNKETGRGINDFNALNKDYSKLSPLEVAREKAIALSGGELNASNVDAFIERKLNIDLKDLQEFDKAELRMFGNDYKEKKIADQEKYKQPIPEAQRANPQGPSNQPEMVSLENGMMVSKEDYSKMQRQHNEYIQAVQKSTDSITSSNLEVKVDDNGTEIVMNLPYDYAKDDKHKMVSYASDVDKFFADNFSTPDGNVDHAKLQESLFWAVEGNRVKAMKSFVHKALAEQALNFTKIKNNTNFKTTQMPTSSNGKKTIPVNQAQQSRGGSIKYSLESFKQN